MNPDCDNVNCLFQHEEGCLDCKTCAYCGSVIDVTDTSDGDSRIFSLLDAGETTVPACDHCRASKDSKRFKIWLKCLLAEEPTYFSLILNNHRHLENTVSLIVKRVNNETNYTAE